MLKSLLDATDRPWLAVGFAFLGVAINVPLNYLLIYGLGPIPALGILGSGIASVLAETIALAAAFFYWRRALPMRRFRLRAVVTRKGVWQQFLQGLPLGISYLAEAGAVAMATFILGWFGAGALAANQIVNSIGATLYMLPLGMATAVAIRIAQADGSGQPERLRPIGMATFGFVALWMLATMVALIFAGRSIAELLSKDATGGRSGVQHVRRGRPDAGGGWIAIDRARSPARTERHQMAVGRFDHLLLAAGVAPRLFSGLSYIGRTTRRVDRFCGGSFNERYRFATSIFPAGPDAGRQRIAQWQHPDFAERQRRASIANGPKHR